MPSPHAHAYDLFEKHKIMEIELWEVASSSNSIFRHKCHVEKEEKG